MKRVLLLWAATMLAVTGLARLASAQTAPKPAAGSDAQPVAVMLEQGIYQEETAGNLEAAAKTYRQIVDQAAFGRSLVAQALSRLAAIQVRQKQLDPARQTIERLKTEYPEQKEIIAKAESLVPNLRTGANEHHEAPPPREPTAEEKSQAAELAKQGWQQYHDGKNETAAETFQRANQLDPKSIDALNGMGWTLQSQHNVNASRYFEKVLELDPKNAMALNGMGWVLWNQESKPDAIEYWKKAIEVDPTATSPLSGLAKYAMEECQFDDAAKWYEKWRSLDPKNVEASKGHERAIEGQKVIDDAMPIALKFLKCIDEGRLEDAKQLTESGDYMLQDQSNMNRWQSVPPNFPFPTGSSGFSAVKSEKWEEMMKGIHGPFGSAMGRKIVSVRGPRGPNSQAATDTPFAPTRRGGGRGFNDVRGMMILNFTTEFENDRRATESVTLQKKNDDEWKIHSYGITKPVVPRDPLKSQ